MSDLEPRELWRIRTEVGLMRAVLVPTGDRASLVVYAGDRIEEARDFRDQAAADEWAFDLATRFSERFSDEALPRFK